MRHRMEERNALLVRRVLLLVPQDGPSDGSSISLSLSLSASKKINLLFVHLSESLLVPNEYHLTCLGLDMVTALTTGGL
jgi:hypothetical protein